MLIPPAFTPEHDVNSAVAIVDQGFADLPDAQAWRTVVCRHRTIPERAATDPQGKAYLPFAGSVACLHIPAPFAQSRQRQFFFASTSCSTVLSRLRSATRFFSLRFFSSGCRMCFSSHGEIPPYLLRHVQNVASEIPGLRRPPVLMYPVQPA